MTPAQLRRVGGDDGQRAHEDGAIEGQRPTRKAWSPQRLPPPARQARGTSSLVDTRWCRRTVEQPVELDARRAIDPLRAGQPHRRVNFDQSVESAHDDTDRIKHPLACTLPVARPGKVDDDLQASTELAVRRGSAQTGSGAQGFDTGRNIGHRIRVQSPSSAVVTNVQRRQQVDALGAANFADDEPVGPHAQGFANERAKFDRAGTFDVRRPRLEPNDVRVLGPELGRIFDNHQPFNRVDATEQRRQQCRLPVPVPPVTMNDRRARTIAASSQRRARSRCRRAVSSANEKARRRGTRNDKQICGRHRWQHGVQPDAVGQPDVGTRHRVVEPPAGRGRQPNRQPSQLLLVGESSRLNSSPAPRSTQISPGPLTKTSVTPGSCSISSSGPAPTRSRRTDVDHVEHICGTAQASLLANQCGHPRSSRCDRVDRQSAANARQHIGVRCHCGSRSDEPAAALVSRSSQQAQTERAQWTGRQARRVPLLERCGQASIGFDETGQRQAKRSRDVGRPQTPRCRATHRNPHVVAQGGDLRSHPSRCRRGPDLGRHHQQHDVSRR